MGKRLDRLCVAGTVLLISFIGFSSQIFVVLPAVRYRYSDPELLRILLPFNLLLASVFYNYALVVRTDPGRVPKGWRPDPRLLETGHIEVKKQTGGPRFCRTCQEYKPPRAHHCRQCKRCVLRMDHHCPWVNNCVGHHNYGHFVRFLLVVDVACSYHLWMITTRALSAMNRFVEPTTTQIVMLVLNYTACVPVLIAVGVFSLFHLWSVVTNTTTIESWEKDRAVSLKRRGKIREYRYPYHLGYVRNVQAVLGENPLWWMWPQPTPGNGLSFPVAIGTSPAQQLEWPPRDEFAPVRRKPARRPPPGEQAFTYGSGLNPALLPSHLRGADLDHPDRATLTLPSEGLRRRSVAPDPAAHEGRGASDSGSSYDSTTTPGSSDGEVDDEDDVPLGQLAARKTRQAAAKVGMGACTEDVTLDEELEGEDDEDLAPGRGVRIRRGSEGYEIRPRGLRSVAAGADGRAAVEGNVSDEWERVEPPDNQ
ncbi:hypothetical protein JCM8115_005119 [Rhodotorula mucilaginosa]